MKINLGCGRSIQDGYFNIDVASNPLAKREPDLLCDVRRIPLPDGCADEVMAIHLYEHVYRWECDDLIDEWKRLLAPGGLLVMEMPDLRKCCYNILHDIEGKTPDQMGMWGIYGDPSTKDPLMIHRFGWTFKTIKPFLVSHGFCKVTEHETKFHATGRGLRDFRVEARKQ